MAHWENPNQARGPRRNDINGIDKRLIPDKSPSPEGLRGYTVMRCGVPVGRAYPAHDLGWSGVLFDQRGIVYGDSPEDVARVLIVRSRKRKRKEATR